MTLAPMLLDLFTIAVLFVFGLALLVSDQQDLDHRIVGGVMCVFAIVIGALR